MASAFARVSQRFRKISEFQAWPTPAKKNYHEELCKVNGKAVERLENSLLFIHTVLDMTMASLGIGMSTGNSLMEETPFNFKGPALQVFFDWSHH
ncbi:unnamed protein product [Sphagnum troendelagicum]